MSKIKRDECFKILVFLALFGLSVGVFDNYRELWMSTNNLSTTSISRVISVSCLVTVLVLFFFTLKVSGKKLKIGISTSLAVKMITSTILLYLNESNNLFLIKFFMFFDIAFSQLILASIYPLIMNITKNDVIYAKKSFVESTFNKLGFLFISIILGKSINGFVVDYNTSLFLSIIFNFISMMVLLNVKIDNNKKDEIVNISESIKYFNNNKVLYLYLGVNILCLIVWNAILGMPMLTLTTKLGFSSNIASLVILGLGICSNFLSMIVIKYFRFKNDQINLFFKFGIRVILYSLIFITNEKLVFITALIYLFLTDCTHNFIFNSFFINLIDEKYSLLLTTLNYCTQLIGKAIGTFLCGIVFNLDFRYYIIPTLIVGILHYILGSVLVEKKKISLKNI